MDYDLDVAQDTSLDKIKKEVQNIAAAQHSNGQYSLASAITIKQRYLANQNLGETRPKAVGQLSELIHH